MTATELLRRVYKALKDGQTVTSDNFHDLNDQLTEIRGELRAIRETMSNYEENT